MLDGFRCCAGSRYEPLDLDTPATCESGFLLHVEAAMLLGLAEAPLDPGQLFARRLFPRRERLPPSMVELHEGRIKARPHGQISVAEPVFAY